MNICIISIQTNICGVLGGVSTHVDQLSAILKSMGHTIVVICPAHPQHPDEDHEEVIEEILYYCIGKISSENLNALWIQENRNAFGKLNKRFPFQCIFSEGVASQGIIKETAIHKIPCYCFLHNFGITHFYNVSKEINNLRALLYYLLLTVPRIIHRIITSEIPTYRSCSMVLSCSSHNANRIRKFYRIKREKIMVIHNWVDTSKFAPVPKVRVLGRRRWHCPENKLTFLMVGSLYLPKGFQVAISSFSEFVKSYRDANLLVAGSGSHEKALKDLAQRLGLTIGGNIHFLGKAQYSDLPLLYNTADIFLMPSLFIEVLPYTLLEAMSCEIPVIASDIAANREALGDSGYFVPRGDIKSLTKAMLHFASNLPQKRSEAVVFRKRVIELFSYDVASNKIKDLLNEISKKKL
jgi:glycosyltransferase involved in cell wall biosynthesis